MEDSPSAPAVPEADALNDHIAHELHRKARAVLKHDVPASPVNGLAAVGNHLGIQALESHVGVKHDPQGLGLRTGGKG